MDLLDTLNISSSGLSVQRVRLQTVASNMANHRTTRTEDGTGPYQRRSTVVQARQLDAFGDQLDRLLDFAEVSEIRVAESEGERVYDPGHPDAVDGYVTYPDINILHEMAELMTVTRAYEANANVVEATFEMAQRAMDIGR